jgi:transcriptional regulator with XRE-family HTH domain
VRDAEGGVTAGETISRGIGQRLRALRLERGLTLDALAMRALTYRPILVRFESGRHVFRLDTVQRLASALGVAPRELLEGVDWDAVDAAARASLKETCDGA